MIYLIRQSHQANATKVSGASNDEIHIVVVDEDGLLQEQKIQF